MKITLHIDDGHTPTIIQLLATLIAKSSAYDGNQDPAMGHPELPLGDPAAADPLKVAMDDPVEDTRPRLVPQTGKAYLTREGVIVKCLRFRGDTHDYECECDAGPFYYLSDGTPRAAALCSPGWDLVEECSF